MVDRSPTRKTLSRKFTAWLGNHSVSLHAHIPSCMNKIGRRKNSNSLHQATA